MPGRAAIRLRASLAGAFPEVLSWPHRRGCSLAPSRIPDPRRRGSGKVRRQISLRLAWLLRRSGRGMPPRCCPASSLLSCAFQVRVGLSGRCCVQCRVRHAPCRKRARGRRGKVVGSRRSVFLPRQWPGLCMCRLLRCATVFRVCGF